MGNRAGRRSRPFIGNVVAGIVTAAMLSGGGVVWTLLRSDRELHVEAVLHDRAGAFGVASPSARASVEVLAPFCGTPQVIVARGIRHGTRSIVCVIVARVWNHTRRTVTLTVASARLRFRAAAYKDLAPLRVLPTLVPPGCAALVALVFEVRPDERGRSVFTWVFTLDARSSVRVAQPFGPMRTSDPLRALPPDTAPAAECPSASHRGA